MFFPTCIDIITYISSKFGSNFFINRIYSHFYPIITIIPQPQANYSLYPEYDKLIIH